MRVMMVRMGAAGRAGDERSVECLQLVRVPGPGNGRAAGKPLPVPGKAGSRELVPVAGTARRA
jgi:hypothetical protein